MTKQRKTSVQHVLKPSHLQAIGQVAAQWNSFEIATMLILSSILNTDLRKTLIMTKHAGVSGWLEMIKASLNQPDLELNQIIQKSEELASQRNNIVHAHWQNTSAPKGPKEGLPFRLKPSDTAIGLSISKKKTKLLLNHQYTSKEMRSIALQIENLENSLRMWALNYQLPKRLAAALRAS